MSYEYERALFEIWASWLRSGRYTGSPKLQRDPISRMMMLGQRKGPLQYVSEQEQDDTGEFVQAFMLSVNDRDITDCLTARHARLVRGRYWPTPEKVRAAGVFDCPPDQTVTMKFRRFCEQGYKMLAEYAREVA